LVLCVDSQTRTWFVHRLVARAFLGDGEPGEVVCHFDGNPANNRVENLRWDTQRANVQDAIRHGTQGPWALCKFGHELTGENLLVVSTTGQRRCRKCKEAYNQRRRALQRNLRSEVTA
jgi:hypothetical protein